MPIFYLPQASAYGQNIKPSDGAKLYFYEAGTTTLKTVYTDAGQTIPATNPVIADGSGRWAVTYVSGTYKIVITDKNDVQIYEEDDLRGFGDSIAYQGDFDSSTNDGDYPATGDKGDMYKVSEAFTLNAASGTHVLIIGNFIICNKDGATGIDADWDIIKGQILDEDTFTSNSDTLPATQQSIKVYVDTTTAAKVADTAVESTSSSTVAPSYDAVNAWLIDEDDMSSNVDDQPPSQQSVKAYVDAQAGDYEPVTTLEGVKQIQDGAIYSFDDWGGTEILQGSADLTSGTLTSGVTYKIKTFVAGDDFSNIGGTNVSGTKFTATGTTPTTWTNSSVLYAEPLAKPIPYKSALSNVWTGCETIGYKGEFQNKKIPFNIGSGFSWIKNRSGANDHFLTGLLNGYEYWISNLTAASAYSLVSFGGYFTDRFETGGRAGGTGIFSNSFIAWNWSYPLAKAWHANGGVSRKVPTPWGLLDSVESNASSGLTGDQVVIEVYNPLTGNGALLYVGNAANRLLDISGGVTPNFMLGKYLTGSDGGYVYHSSMTSADYYMKIDTTAAETNSANIFNDTDPTANLISVGATGINYTGALHILYYFSPIAGLQAFGGYAGDGSATLRNIATGCKDGLSNIKLSAGGTGNWVVHDSFRGDNLSLLWNSTAVEGSLALAFNGTSGLDISSTSGDLNASGDDYIYSHFGKEMVIQDDFDVFPVDAITSDGGSNSTVKITFEYKGSATLNSELLAYATRESTPNWVLASLSKVADLSDGYEKITATIDISGNAAGTAMRWRMATSESPYTEHNIKNLKISWS